MTNYYETTITTKFEVCLTFQQSLVLHLLAKRNEITGYESQLRFVGNLSAVISELRDFGIVIITIPATYTINQNGTKQICTPLKYKLGPGITCAGGGYAFHR